MFLKSNPNAFKDLSCIHLYRCSWDAFMTGFPFITNNVFFWLIWMIFYCLVMTVYESYGSFLICGELLIIVHYVSVTLSRWHNITHNMSHVTAGGLWPGCLYVMCNVFKTENNIFREMMFYLLYVSFSNYWKM